MPLKSNEIPSVKYHDISPIEPRHEFAWDEVGKAALPTLLPFGVLGLGRYLCLQRKDQELWFKGLKKPSWVLENQEIGGVVGLAALAPVGYASYLIYKEVAGGTERQVALGLYGATLVSWLAGIPAYTQTKDMSCWFGASLLSTSLLGATAVAFHKVNETAGMLIMPMAIWSAYITLCMFATMQTNPNAGTDWTPKK